MQINSSLDGFNFALEMFYKKKIRVGKISHIFFVVFLTIDVFSTKSLEIYGGNWDEERGLRSNEGCRYE